MIWTSRTFPGGGDGNAYEGRGYLHRPIKMNTNNPKQMKYKRKSLDIAYIGNFQDKSASYEMKRAFGCIIEYAIEQDYLKQLFKLRRFVKKKSIKEYMKQLHFEGDINLRDFTLRNINPEDESKAKIEEHKENGTENIANAGLENGDDTEVGNKDNTEWEDEDDTEVGKKDSTNWEHEDDTELENKGSAEWEHEGDMEVDNKEQTEVKSEHYREVENKVSTVVASKDSADVAKIDKLEVENKDNT